MKCSKLLLSAATACLMTSGAARAEIVVDNPGGLLTREELEARRAGRISVPQPRDPTKAPAATSSPQELGDTMEFLDRDRFRGTLISLTPEPFGLTWKRVDMKDLAMMATTNLMQIRLAGRKLPGHKDPTVVVRLLNGDLLAGDIVMLDETSLTLDTWYSGRITIKRPAILQVVMKGAAGRALYEGPNSLNEWVAIQGGGGRLRDQWRYDNGSLFAVYPSPLVKRFDSLPDQCEFRFTVSWMRYAQFGFMFFAEIMDQSPVSGYNLTVSGSTVYLQAFSRNMGSQQLGSIQYEKFDRGKRTAEFTILANRKTNTFTVMIDGEQVRRWTDARNLGGGQAGQAIMLQPQDQNSIRFRNIRVAEWDGKVPDPSAAPTAQKEDIVRLNNSDKLSGKLNSISNDTIQFTTSYATLTVPIKRVEEILFAVQSTAAPAPEAGSVRMSFAETGILTVRINKIADEQVSCTGAAFGDMALPLPALRALDFNLDRKRPAAGDESSFSEGGDVSGVEVLMEQ